MDKGSLSYHQQGGSVMKNWEWNEIQQQNTQPGITANIMDVPCQNKMAISSLTSFPLLMKNHSSQHPWVPFFFHWFLYSLSQILRTSWSFFTPGIKIIQTSVSCFSWPLFSLNSSARSFFFTCSSEISFLNGFTSSWNRIFEKKIKLISSLETQITIKIC